MNTEFRSIDMRQAQSPEDIGRLAVVLMQLGGPDSLNAVEPFLYNLFSDPDIIDFPFARLARPTLARMISSRRARKVQAHYASIGGRSPIRELTELQAEALEIELRKKVDARVFVAMRYWHPMTEETVSKVISGGFRNLVLLPLYPQFSRTTTGSSLNEWHRKYSAAGQDGLVTHTVKEFFDRPAYVEAMIEKINEGLAKFQISGTSEHANARSPEHVHPVHLIFSAHGVPLSIIEAGDPYQKQIEATVKIIMERGTSGNPHLLCYQSRVGPGKWLQPSLDDELRRLAGVGVKKVLVIPIAFVSDHVETLSEINIEARQKAAEFGIQQFEVMPALNNSPKFIQALSEIVFESVGLQI